MEFGATFFVALAFILFVALLVFFTPLCKIIANGLDGRAERIKNELGEALRLKEEAQALLASYQRKQKEVAEEAENILKEASLEAERITKDSARELEEVLNKRVEIAMQKIANHEQAVIQQVKNHAIDVAVDTVKAVITESLNKDLSDKLVSKAVTDIGQKLN